MTEPAKLARKVKDMCQGEHQLRNKKYVFIQNLLDFSFEIIDRGFFYFHGHISTSLLPFCIVPQNNKCFVVVS